MAVEGSNVPEAQLCVANFYVDDSGVDRDEGRRRRYRHWLAKAVAMGDEDAARELTDA